MSDKTTENEPEKRLADVGTEVLDELEELGEERSILLGRIDKLESDVREKITDVVYERVRSDYQDRLKGIDEKARPLHRRAKEAWATLHRLRAAVGKESETISLDVEELKVRQQLGEFSEEEVEERLAEMESEKEQREEVLEEAAELDERFERVIEASGGKVERLRPRDEPESEEGDDGEDEESADSEEEDDGEESGEAEDEEEEDEEEGGSEEEAEEEDVATVEAEAPDPEGVTQAGVPPVPADGEPSPDDGDHDTVEAVGAGAPPVPEDFQQAVTAEIPKVQTPVMDDGRTKIARPAKLELEEPLHGVEDFRIQPLTVIGRTPQSQIQLDHLSVSRRHAKLTLTGEGYELEDLGSENGTFVNGKRVEKRVLADGDRVLIGTVSMRFRAPE